MCKTWNALVVAAVVGAGLIGCHKPQYLQPPKPKDEFVQPPADDPRFTNAPKYPDKLLNQDSQPKDPDGPETPGRGPGSHGGMGSPH